MARNVLCARWEAPSRKINISERALRGKFFSKFFPWIRKNPEGSSSKENFIFLRVLLPSSHVDFFETHDSQGAQRTFLATGSWITLIISQTQWQEMFSALAERRRLEKINISERALRGKFSFEIFSVNTEKILKEVLRKKTSYFFASSTALLSCWFFRDARLAGSAENFATGSWITLIISQTQWQEMFSALAERRRLEKINISERALRGKFFRNFFREYGKILKEVLRKKTSYFFASSTAPFHVDFFETHDSQGAQRTFLATGSWITLIISQTQWQEMFSALAERRRLEKINISERALRGKFSFEIFSVNTEKILKEVLRKKTSYFFASSTAPLMLIFFETHDSQGAQRTFSATGSWITLIISQTQWQEMFSALAERRRLEKSTSQNER